MKDINKQNNYETVSLKFKIPEDEEEKAISAIESYSLFDLIKTKIDIQTHCKQGNCGVCRCPKPSEGEVKYKDGEIPLGYVDKDTEGNDIQVLSCISKIDVRGMIEKGKLINRMLEVKFKVPLSMTKTIEHTLAKKNSGLISNDIEPKKKTSNKLKS